MEITVNEHKMANIAEAILARTDRGMSFEEAEAQVRHIASEDCDMYQIESGIKIARDIVKQEEGK